MVSESKHVSGWELKNIKKKVQYYLIDIVLFLIYLRAGGLVDREYLSL